VWLLVCGGVLGAGWVPGHAAEPPRYKTNYKTIRSLGLDLYRAMKPPQKSQVNPEPVSIDEGVGPFVKLVEYAEEDQPMRFVLVSVGFIDLLNNVAHAKAIDAIQKGYFEKYVLSLAQETGEQELRPLPNLENPAFWTEAILNEQLSNFSQMVGAAVAIKLSHHYLGHYKKYAPKLVDGSGKTVPINNLLLPQEWEQAMRTGVRNALEAGLGIEGIKALYDAIDKMPKRPEWTAYFLPAAAKVKAMKKDMEVIEKKFFAGEE
jgi:hypothetical protein